MRPGPSKSNGISVPVSPFRSRTGRRRTLVRRRPTPGFAPASVGGGSRRAAEHAPPPSRQEPDHDCNHSASRRAGNACPDSAARAGCSARRGIARDLYAGPGRGHDDPAVRIPRLGRGPGGPQAPDHGDAVARPRDGHRRFSRRAAGDDTEARRLLGERVRLAPMRGAAQCAAQFRHRDRRARHPLRPRAVEARKRAAGDRDARLAGLGGRMAGPRRTHSMW